MASGQTRSRDLSAAKQMVRTFSWKAYSDDPNDDLAQSLVVAEAIDTHTERAEGTLTKQWEELFALPSGEASNHSSEEVILATSTAELAKAYKDFLKCLPKGHEARTENGPPKFKTVFDAVVAADSAWKKNRESSQAGRLKTLFGKVCGSLNNHQSLFAVIPSGDKYICLLTGTMSAIVKATVNHEKIAEGVSNALDDLSDDIKYWRETLEVYKDHMMMGTYVAKLYVVVFQFLVSIMTRWSKSSGTRFLRSFDCNFFKDEIDAKKDRIRELERKFERQGMLEMQRHIQNAPTKDEIAAIVTDSQARFQSEWILKAEQLKRDLGRTVKNGLEEGFLSLLWQQRDEYRLSASPTVPRLQEASTIADAQGLTERTYLKEQVVLAACRRLQQNAQQEHVPEFVAQSQELSVHIEIFMRIQQWNAAKEPQILWIQGPFQAPTPSRYTNLSMYVLATAQRASIPAISYFCDTDTDMVKMVYSLILQLIELIPDDFHSDLDFTSARFDILDGTNESIFEAINLLEDLFSVGPYLVFVIVDGLQRLDTATNAESMDKLVKALSSAGRDTGQGSSRMAKILLTTDGMVEALLSLRMDEKLDVLDFTGEEDGSVEVDGMEVDFL